MKIVHGEFKCVGCIHRLDGSPELHDQMCRIASFYSYQNPTNSHCDEHQYAKGDSPFNYPVEGVCPDTIG